MQNEIDQAENAQHFENIFYVSIFCCYLTECRRQMN